MRGKLIGGGIYHVLNRGVDKRKIFLGDSDYLRFIDDLCGFNDANSSVRIFNLQRRKSSSNVRRRSEIADSDKPKELMVEMLAFCLMPNHYHLLIKSKSESSIPEFIKKLNGGYAKYFNIKYERKGTLFEGRYKSVAVTRDAHFLHLPFYIHFNPLDLVMPEWRSREITDYKKAMRFLENYRWSSYRDYIGKRNFPSATQQQLLSELLGGPEQFEENTRKWLKEIDCDEIGDSSFE